MYRAVYKCRLCGETAESEVSRLAALSTAKRIINPDPFVFETEPKALHTCANGSKGIMDLLGYRFYGDK